MTIRGGFMSVATKFSVHTAEYWDFKDAKKDDIHSIAHYPATMVAPKIAFY